MVAQGVKTVGFIGFNDAYGQGGLAELKKAAPAHGVDIVDTESFARSDTNLSSQASHLVNANPDAVLIWAIPPAGNVAQKAIQDAGYQVSHAFEEGVAAAEDAPDQVFHQVVLADEHAPDFALEGPYALLERRCGRARRVDLVGHGVSMASR